VVENATEQYSSDLNPVFNGGDSFSNTAGVELLEAMLPRRSELYTGKEMADSMKRIAKLFSLPLNLSGALAIARIATVFQQSQQYCSVEL
jgi:hypothetical protein